MPRGTVLVLQRAFMIVALRSVLSMEVVMRAAEKRRDVVLSCIAACLIVAIVLVMAS